MNKKEKASMISEELKSRNRRPLYKAEEVKVGLSTTMTSKLLLVEGGERGCIKS